MPNENVGPRMAFTRDGKIVFFDEKGGEIKASKRPPKQFVNLVNNNNNLESVQTFSVYTFGPGSNCKIVITFPGGSFCFWVDCTTGQYKRECTADEYP